MKTQYLIDDSGKVVAVVLPIQTYTRLLAEVSEPDDILRNNVADAHVSAPRPELYDMLDDLKFGYTPGTSAN